MTNYAAFYVGRDTDAEWLGTVRGFAPGEGPCGILDLDDLC